MKRILCSTPCIRLYICFIWLDLYLFLVTFIIFQIIYTVVQVSANNYMGEDTTVDLNFVLAPRFTLWFLLSLYCWNVLLFLFAKFRWWTVLVAFAVGISISFIDVNTFL